MKVKWGKCPDCEDGSPDKPLTNKLCQYHNKKKKAAGKATKPSKPRKPINSVSTKEAARIRKYLKIRAKWLPEHDVCEMMITPECQYFATDVHHTKGKIGELLFDTRFWKAGCRKCHRHAEDHPEEARQKGITLEK